MRKFMIYLSAIAVLTLIGVGCQQGAQPVGPETDSAPQHSPLFGYVLPDGATLVSATLYVSSDNGHDTPVTAHAATADWDELVVTWNNFGGAYDAAVEGSTTFAAPGWQTWDLTSLVQAWMSGDRVNYGLLLRQPEEDTGRTRYSSSEGAVNNPYMQICFTLDSVEYCDDLSPLADAFIWELYPNENYGEDQYLYTGYVANDEGGFTEKQSLLKFDIDFQEELPAAIGDYVWHDVDMDGEQDVDEPGIPRVTVNLYNCDDVFQASMETDEFGFYLFDGLAAGDYYVEFILPAGYVFTTQNAVGVSMDLDSDADENTGMAVCTTLDPGETDLTWDAGMYMPAPPLAAIGDYVWHDVDRDGEQDVDEPGIPGVTVNLYLCDDVFQASMETDEFGYYLFGDLAPGDYYVEFVLPAGYVFTMQNAVGVPMDLDSDADMSTGMAVCTTLDPGETDLTWDAGMYMPEQDGCTLTIGYWKNRCGQGNGNQADEVTPLLPIWLGNDGGAESVYVDSAELAYEIFKWKFCDDSNENGIAKLYAQLLAAKLNILSGASSTDIYDTIMAADAFLADHGCDDWSELSEEDQGMVDDLKTMADNYNNGDIGPGHCDDDDDSSDDDSSDDDEEDDVHFNK